MASDDCCCWVGWSGGGFMYSGLWEVGSTNANGFLPDSVTSFGLLVTHIQNQGLLSRMTALDTRSFTSLCKPPSSDPQPPRLLDSRPSLCILSTSKTLILCVKSLSNQYTARQMARLPSSPQPPLEILHNSSISTSHPLAIL